MTNKIVLVDHHHEPPDNLVSTLLSDRGFALEWQRPFAGDTLEPPDTDMAGVVVLGGAPNIDQMDQFEFLHDEALWVEQCLKQEVPVLGLCLGGQLLAHVLGAAVTPHPKGLEEFGLYPIHPVGPGPAFVPENFHVVQFHSRGFDIPDGATALAGGELFPNQAFGYGTRAVGLQFHPECTLTILRRWQALDNLPWHNPGAQSIDRQNQLAEQHLAAVASWFEEFLDGFFGSPVTPSF